MTMTLSPIQPNYVTKNEFGEFKSEVKSEFLLLRGEIKEFKNEILEKMDEHKEEIKADFKYSIDVMHEKFQDDLKVTNEYLGYIKEVVDRQHNDKS